MEGRQVLISIFLFTLALLLVAGILYWLLVITEGSYLGRRFLVWTYDLTASRYDNIKEFDDALEEAFVARPLLRRLHHLPAPRILDVATGTGRVPWYLLQTPTFHGRIVGLDPSRKMLALAAAKLAPFSSRVALVRQTAVPLPFPDACFDAVTCLESLEFFPSDTAALREMVRVLAPGGVLFITRRRGWEARTFLGRYRASQKWETLLADLDLYQIETQPWQVDYDQIFARKRATS